MKICVRFCAHLERNSPLVYRSEVMFGTEVVEKLKHTLCEQYCVCVRRFGTLNQVPLIIPVRTVTQVSAVWRRASAGPDCEVSDAVRLGNAFLHTVPLLDRFLSLKADPIHRRCPIHCIHRHFDPKRCLELQWLLYVPFRILSEARLFSSYNFQSSSRAHPAS
jgi:hypothetical protein